MLSEYALDPKAIEDIKDLRLLREAFGLTKGRLLAELPAGWAKAVGQCIVPTGGLNDVRVTELLKHLQDNMTRRSAAGGMPFLAAAQAEHLRSPFRAILTDGANVKGIPTVPFQEATDSPLWAETRSVPWPRRPGTVRDTLPLFAALSREIQIIDPYFTLEKSACRHFLQELLELIRAKRGPQACHIRLQIHLGLTHAGPMIDKAAWTGRLERIAPWVPLTVRVCHWSEATFGNRFHNRYLINDRGGIQFGDGLELKAAAGGLDTANLLGEAAYQELHARLERNIPDQDCQWVIQKSRGTQSPQGHR